MQVAVVRGWPEKKLAENVSFVARDPSLFEHKKLAVLLTTGALNPVHNGHLDILERARRFIEAQHSFKVLGGYISPSHALYVEGKCKWNGQVYFPTKDRVGLTQLACEGSNWIDCATWESSRTGYWPDFPEVLKDLQDFLAERADTKDRDIKVLYVCGLDHAQRCGLSSGFDMPNIGVVILPRSGDAPTESDPDRLIFAATEGNSAVEQLSSTEIRKLLESGGKIPEAWMSSRVSEELARMYAKLPKQ